MRVFNTLGRRMMEFRPLEKGKVRMYTCGPTVYDLPHVGNYRSFFMADMIRRYLEYKGYKVTYVTNFTDVDDKMIKRARELNTTIFNLAERFIGEYFEQMEKLSRGEISIQEGIVQSKLAHQIMDGYKTQVRMIEVVNLNNLEEQDIKQITYRMDSLDV